MSALNEFNDAMQVTEGLLNLESQYDPLVAAERPIVFGLRGGAAVLMVAAFEGFLKNMFKENLDLLGLGPPIDWRRGPVPDLFVSNICENVRIIAWDFRRMKKEKKKASLRGVQDICKRLGEGTIVHNAFCNTKSSPSVAPLREMFQRVGIDDVLRVARADFESRYGDPIPKQTEDPEQDFLSYQLGEIVKRRHQIAHTGDASRFTGVDLKQDAKILKVLASVLNDILRTHINHLALQYGPPKPTVDFDLSTLFQ